jgi:hypothetical protein
MKDDEAKLNEDGYEAARRQFFSVKPRPLSPFGQPLPLREELHDRARLR